MVHACQVHYPRMSSSHLDILLCSYRNYKIDLATKTQSHKEIRNNFFPSCLRVWFIVVKYFLIKNLNNVISTLPDSGN